MKTKLRPQLFPAGINISGVLFSFCILLCAACTGEAPPPAENINSETGVERTTVNKSIEPVLTLEQIAEIERSGVYVPGLAFIESGIRENNGDYTGAVIAAYKELSYAYSFGSISKSQAEEGLLAALEQIDSSSGGTEPPEAAMPALKGCIAFAREEWDEAETLLAGIQSGDDEPDSFIRWMLLVCRLENNGGRPEDSAGLRSAYGAIRARYRHSPEYWYRSARAFSADVTIAAAYAEQCIDASPKGPFAYNAREIIASNLYPSSGKNEDAGSIRSVAEIEAVIRLSVSLNKPETLEDLFPLIALPDNPYTLYALGAMKSLSSVPEYKSFFAEGALKSSGRLAERLNYISRG